MDAVLAVGGGSVIDEGKAVAAAVFYDGDPWDFCVGRARVERALPLGAILTLAATGSEMNAGAVISNEETREKLPMFGACLKPRFSILDPTFTFTLPPTQTAAGVADIISHCFEQYFSPTPATYLADRLAEAVIRTCVAFGPQALARPDDYDARAELMWASSWGLNDLLSCGKEGDWAVHMVEHELSALNDLSHGVGLAILTPSWMRYVADTPARVAKVATYGRNVWRLEGSDDDVAAAAIERTASFFAAAMKLPGTLKEVGFGAAELKVAATQATRFGPLGRFRELNEGDILAILRAAA